jgi:hypothetical protein
MPPRTTTFTADTTVTTGVITVAVTMAATLTHLFKRMATTAIHRTTAAMDMAKLISHDTSNGTPRPTDRNPIASEVACTLISDASMF